MKFSFKARGEAVLTTKSSKLKLRQGWQGKRQETSRVGGTLGVVTEMPTLVHTQCTWTHTRTVEALGNQGVQGRHLTCDRDLRGT